jgi:kumamolisin
MKAARPWRRIHRPTFLLALAALALAGALAAADPTVAPRAMAASQTASANAGGDEGSTAVIGLRRNQNGLSAFALARATPGTGAYRDYASVSTLAGRYGASEDTWRRVRGYLRRKGIRDAKLDTTRGFATAQLSQRQRRRAFPPPRRLRRLIGPVLFPSDFAQHRPRVAPTRPHVAERSGGPQRTGTPRGCAQGVGSGGLTPNQYRTAYGVDPLHARGLLGQGTRIALVETDGFNQTDLGRFARCFGFAAPHPTVHLVGLESELPPATETQLDTQIVAAIAPMARMDIFQSENAPAALVPLFAAPLNPAMTGGKPPQVISASLGFCEPMFGKRAAKLLEYVLAMTAGTGVTVVVAAGDTGSSACYPPKHRLDVAYPGSSAFVTSVGGTRLTLTPSNEIASEVVWNDAQFGSPSAGGGGRSRLAHRPDYQPGHAGAFSFRKVPDVAFHSSRFPGYAILTPDEGWAQVDGTSAAAPVLGAGALLAVQAEARAGVKPSGLLNPLLYQAAGAGTPGLFNDVTTGDNDLLRVGCCSARPGYDRASGWGSLDLASLADLVVDAGR